MRWREWEAWERLVSLYSPRFHHWCWQGGIAADVTQEDFAVVASSLSQFRPDQPRATFRGWMRDHAAQATLDHTLAREQPAVGGTDAQIRLQQVPAPADEVELSESPADISGLYHRAHAPGPASGRGPDLEGFLAGPGRTSMG